MTASPDPSGDARSARARDALILWRALALTLACWAASPALAEAPAPELEIQPARDLALGEHASLIVLVRLPGPSADLPLLLTPHIEGAAVELVRGRLLRSDAKQLDSARLRFELPVVARSAGTAILRVDLLSYLCDARCRPIEASTRAVLRVR